MTILGPFFDGGEVPEGIRQDLPGNSDRQGLGLDELKVGGRLVAANFARAEKS